MKSLAALAFLAVPACTSATAPLALRSHATPPALALSSEPVARRSFPERLSPAQLPTAERQHLAGRHAADVRLCVAPDGSVSSLDLARPSGSTRFDRALAADLPGWKYEPYAAPAGIKVCEQVTIAYVAN